MKSLTEQEPAKCAFMNWKKALNVSVKGFEGLLITLTKFQEKLSLKALLKTLKENALTHD
ncbi:TPA: hypothetical protein ACNRZ3_003381 [Escherichia coli]